jgi:hypothetical protein
VGVLLHLPSPIYYTTALQFGGRRELVKGKCWGGREREVGEGRSLVGGGDGR